MHQDAGAKVHHLASNTTSKILSKSITKNGGRGSYRGLVSVSKKAENCKVNVVCDAHSFSTSKANQIPILRWKSRTPPADANTKHRSAR